MKEDVRQRPVKSGAYNIQPLIGWGRPIRAVFRGQMTIYRAHDGGLKSNIVCLPTVWSELPFCVILSLRLGEAGVDGLASPPGFHSRPEGPVVT